MELSILVHIVADGYSNIKTLYDFFADDTLCSILRSIADNEYKAALEALEASKKSNNSNILIGEAIGHLRSSYISDLEAANKRRFIGLLKAKSITRVTSYKKAIQSLLLMSICYKRLEDDDNAIDTLKQVTGLLPLYRMALIDEMYDSYRTRSAAIGSLAAQGELVSDEQKDLDHDIEEDEKEIDSYIYGLKEAVDKIVYI